MWRHWSKWRQELHDRDEPATALEILSRARKLKPLDESLVGLRNDDPDVSGTQPGSPATLGRGASPVRGDRTTAARRAACLLLPGAGRQSSRPRPASATWPIATSEKPAALLPEPAPLWLSLHVESIRFRLTKATQKHYAELWKKKLEKKVPQRDGRCHGIVPDRIPCPRESTTMAATTTPPRCSSTCTAPPA